MRCRYSLSCTVRGSRWSHGAPGIFRVISVLVLSWPRWSCRIPVLQGRILFQSEFSKTHSVFSEIPNPRMRERNPYRRAYLGVLAMLCGLGNQPYALFVALVLK